jgi:protease-4
LEFFVSVRKDWILGLGIAGFTILIILILAVSMSVPRGPDGLSLSSGGDKVAVVELVGPIYDSRRLVRLFRECGENGSVKAVVFRIDSPGGGVAAAQEIYDAVRKVRDSGKPVVASFGSVAASGGYYVACGADTIMANPGTTTGSIGVIAEFVNMKELMRKIGISMDVVKSGRYKDTGSPHRELTPSERIIMQAWVDDAFDQFVEVVARERGLARRAVLDVADGRVFTGRQAVKRGLVDLLGNAEDAIALAARMGQIQGVPAVVRESRRRMTLFDLVFQEMEGILRGRSGWILRYSWY